MKNREIPSFLAVRFSDVAVQVAFAQSGTPTVFRQNKNPGGFVGRPRDNRPAASRHRRQRMQVSLRVTSMGNALVREMTGAGRPDDPITLLYLDGDRLLLSHYCDAGNRPRMAGKTSPDGKTVEFDFLDVAGSTQYGHVHHVVFTVIDANHHAENWIYMMPGDKPVHAHFDLQRTK